MPNHSNLTAKSNSMAKMKRSEVMQNYTFKLAAPTRKRNDPVSLFQRTSEAWKRNKFLLSQANNK